MVAGFFELLLQNDDILGAETGDDVHLYAAGVEILGLGIGDGAAYAAADDGHPLDRAQLQPGVFTVQQVGGSAEGADKVQNVIALL